MKCAVLLILCFGSIAIAEFDTLKMNGQWEWVKTNAGGFLNPEYTPESEGIYRSLKVIATEEIDSVSFEASFYRNDTLTDSAVGLDSFFVCIISWMTEWDIGDNQPVLDFQGDSIFIVSLDAAESPFHFYRRICSTSVNYVENSAKLFKHQKASKCLRIGQKHNSNRAYNCLGRSINISNVKSHRGFHSPFSVYILPSVGKETDNNEE